jgi:hypothetical protein
MSPAANTGSGVPSRANSVNLQSDPGDFIGAGGAYSYTQANADIFVSASGGNLTVRVEGDQHWTGEFLVPNTLNKLQPGSYNNAQPWPSQSFGTGSITWFGEGRGSSAGGSFTIDNVTYVNDVLTAIDLQFVQNDDSDSATLHGQIHWNSSDTTMAPGPVNPPPKGLWQPPRGATPSSGNYVYLQSDPGDLIGAGKTYIYTKAQLFVIAAEGFFEVSVISGTDIGSMGDFHTMNNLNKFQPGYYNNVQRYPFNNPTKGGLNWSEQSRGSNTLTGWFNVDKVTYVNSVLTAIDLRFEQHSDGILPALHGQIHWVK